MGSVDTQWGSIVIILCSSFSELAPPLDGYMQPPPLARILSPQAGMHQILPPPQTSPLLHPLVGQHVLSVRQYSKEQVTCLKHRSSSRVMAFVEIKESFLS